MTVLALSSNEKDLGRVVMAVQQLAAGRSNANGRCKLNSGVTSTTVIAPNCGKDSAVLLFPATAAAASMLTNVYVLSVGNGTFTVGHNSTVLTDLSFFYVCIG